MVSEKEDRPSEIGDVGDDGFLIILQDGWKLFPQIFPILEPYLVTKHSQSIFSLRHRYAPYVRRFTILNTNIKGKPKHGLTQRWSRYCFT